MNKLLAARVCRRILLTLAAPVVMVTVLLLPPSHLAEFAPRLELGIAMSLLALLTELISCHASRTIIYLNTLWLILSTFVMMVLYTTVQG